MTQQSMCGFYGVPLANKFCRPQPLAVSDVSVNGDQMTVLDDTLYLQTDTFSACVPESEVSHCCKRLAL